MTKLLDLGLKFGDWLFKIQEADGHLATLRVVCGEAYGLSVLCARQPVLGAAGARGCPPGEIGAQWATALAAGAAA
jgi:hypothetical protein